ncbi:hypothetical protein [Ottowia testudinis]|uniref:Uncharacterized protein n=1 Tax=Ottowia testudinis TaxID=2816950 RepID=A0A975H607_9BURK|nr:hypothetical protein [Ottowia testudinis]QTD45512.1 hypothetical protein J1M35_00860 [Ottowia testudinis]
MERQPGANDPAHHDPAPASHQKPPDDNPQATDRVTNPGGNTPQGNGPDGLGPPGHRLGQDGGGDGGAGRRPDLGGGAGAGGGSPLGRWAQGANGINVNTPGPVPQGMNNAAPGGPFQPGFTPQPGVGRPNAWVPANGQPNPLPLGATGANALPGVGTRPNALPPAGVPGVNVNGSFVPGTGARPGVVGQPMAGMAQPGMGVLAPIGAGAGAGIAGPSGLLLSKSLAQPLGAVMPLARQPANAPWTAPSQALNNPRAEAAAAALQGKPLASTTVMHTALPPAAPANPAAARAALAAPGSAQAVALAQAALAQVLGKVMAGQTTAGTGAVALAEAQLAVRASKLALTQAALAGGQAGGRAGTAALTAQPAAPGLRTGAGVALAPAAGTAARAGALGGSTQASRADQIQISTRRGAQAAGAGGEPAHATPLAGAPMPRALAAALARAPKLRKRGSHDRVEAVDRHTPRQQAPEMEDEDFWDGAGDEDDTAAFAGDTPGDADAQRQDAALAAAQHYRALHLWLAANDQRELLRELAAGRRVLLLAPPDKTHLRLIGHLLRPDAQQAPAPGATGRAWALAARWSATLPADAQWRVWRIRQGEDAAGVWHVGASQPDRHTPRLLAADDTGAPAAASVGEHIAFLELRRLRRLMGSQWTMTVLRVPVPLDDTGPPDGAG